MSASDARRRSASQPTVNASTSSEGNARKRGLRYSGIKEFAPASAVMTWSGRNPPGAVPAADVAVVPLAGVDPGPGAGVRGAPREFSAADGEIVTLSGVLCAAS